MDKSTLKKVDVTMEIFGLKNKASYVKIKMPQSILTKLIDG